MKYKYSFWLSIGVLVAVGVVAPLALDSLVDSMPHEARDMVPPGLVLSLAAVFLWIPLGRLYMDITEHQYNSFVVRIKGQTTNILRVINRTVETFYYVSGAVVFVFVLWGIFDPGKVLYAVYGILVNIPLCALSVGLEKT